MKATEKHHSCSPPHLTLAARRTSCSFKLLGTTDFLSPRRPCLRCFVHVDPPQRKTREERRHPPRATFHHGALDAHDITSRLRLHENSDSTIAFFSCPSHAWWKITRTEKSVMRHRSSSPSFDVCQHQEKTKIGKARRKTRRQSQHVTEVS